ncbi:MAG TPA: heparan-alpha-glucosaminide N-acetyltransferase domain-containing protein [Puia sp.]|nr:heparan-alpha-glucosaminide N-acetyltransferase domain-containing protein [Puia sp.]
MATATALAPKYRIGSIDLLRGLVMLIMAVDHIRDHVHLGHPDPTDLATTTPALFLTRWITHFCAPVFVFLSGVSVYLAGTRRTGNQLSVFLIKRGLWLIVVEVVLISLALTLNPIYSVLVLQVIWAIGGSMILLGLLIGLKVPRTVMGIIGGIIVFGHNIFDLVDPGAVGKTFYWHLLVSADGFGGANILKIGHHHFIGVLYALLPWTGVMLIGYVIGPIYSASFDAVRRRKLLLYSGLGALAFFLLFRAFNIYGDPAPWSVQKTAMLSVLSFLNVTKYPCSLLYLCMTLGLGLIILARAEYLHNRLASIVIVYGNVPFFYYICHWYLIAIIHIIVFFAEGFTTGQIVDPNQPFLFGPDGCGVGLAGVWLIWLLVIVLLYRPCKWFSTYKKTHRQWWLSYL